MEYCKIIKNSIDDDMKKFVVGPEAGFERLYIFQLANNWIEKNVKTAKDFEEKIRALKEIIGNEKFRKAIELGDEAYNMNLDEDFSREKGETIRKKAEEAASLIVNIRKDEEYIKKSKIAGYEILEKYEDPYFYVDNSLKEQIKIVEELYEYLLGKQKITEKYQKDESSNERG